MSSRGHGSPIRRKLDLDLADSVVTAEVGADQIEYYRNRAGWFDDCYNCTGDYDRGPVRNARWNAEMRRIEAALEAVDLTGACVELGAGTGQWTQLIAKTAKRVTAIDASQEMLDIARSKLADLSNIEYVREDLWHWQPNQIWDGAAAFFFIEHVPDDVLTNLLATLHMSLRPGSPFFIAEASWEGHEPLVETREIDGREYRVVERRRSRNDYATAFDRAGFDVVFGQDEFMVDLVATRR